MKLCRSLAVLLALCPLSAQGSQPWIEARAETQAIPMGQTHTDDAAIWWNAKDPTKSLILGTSKYGKEGKGGLGVYSLSGQELQFLSGSKLNSIDLIDKLAVATNRSEKALDFFAIKKGRVSQVGRQPLVNPNGLPLEPYGLCIGPSSDDYFTVYLPLKDGHLLAYEVEEEAPHTIRLIADYDLSASIPATLDAKIRDIVYKAAVAENELDELEEALDERFILEGCVYDAKRQQLYVGMENAGVWRLPLGGSPEQPQLMLGLSGSWTDVGSWAQAGTPRISDDIEGIDILTYEDRDYLLISVQGLSEFALFDLNAGAWTKSIRVRLGQDLVSNTDGLAVSTQNFGRGFEAGLLVVHDDLNTEGDQIMNANYKIISLKDIWTE